LVGCVAYDVQCAGRLVDKSSRERRFGI
jgi:hypothetical protein